MTLARKLLLAGVAIGMTVLGLLLAVCAGDPAVRKILGRLSAKAAGTADGSWTWEKRSSPACGRASASL